MRDELMSVLSADAEAVDRNAPELDDRALGRLHETLLLVRELDEQLGRLQEQGDLGLWVPAADAAASGTALASVLEDGDWLYPSFRDWAAYLVRGGSLRHLVAQALATSSDPQRGRQLPGQPSLDDGRYVPPSAALGSGVARAAGTAVAMKIRADGGVTAVLCGAAAADQPGFWMGLQIAARHRAPLVAMVRTPSSSDAAPARRAVALGLEAERVDGDDVLALVKASRSARDRAVAGDGATVIEAVVAGTEAEAGAGPIARLRPYLEHRGLSDPGRDSELAERCRERVRAAVESAIADAPADPATLHDDVTAEPTWMLREQAERSGREPRR